MSQEQAAAGPTQQDLDALRNQLQALEAKLGASTKPTHSVGGPNPRALTLDLKDMENHILNLLERVTNLERSGTNGKS